jgi:hypothetical protein
MRTRRALAAALTSLAACATPTGIEATGLRPYALPVDGRLTWLLCRWPDGEPIPVALPGEAGEAEAAALEAALAAWERTLGVRFERRAAGQLAGELAGLPKTGIEIELREALPAFAANTVAECAVDPAALAPEAGPPKARLPARIVYASVHLARGDPRLAGAALHELGHALGFQGHAGRGPTAMVTATRSVRERGERALAGEALEDAALEALYAVPSGRVLARGPLPAGRTAALDALLARARLEGWRGPWLRLGDDEGRIAWLDPRDPQGRWLGFRLGRLAVARRDAAALEIEPDPGLP